MSQEGSNTPLTHSFLERCVAASKAYVAHCRNTVGKIDSGVLQDGYRKVAEMALSRALDFQQEVYTMLEAGTAASETREYYCGPCDWNGMLPKPQSGHPRCPDCEALLSEAPVQPDDKRVHPDNIEVMI